MKAIVRTSVQHREAITPCHAESSSCLFKSLIEAFLVCLMEHLHLLRLFLAKKNGFLIRNSRENGFFNVLGVGGFSPFTTKIQHFLKFSISNIQLVIGIILKSGNRGGQEPVYISLTGPIVFLSARDATVLQRLWNSWQQKALSMVLNSIGSRHIQYMTTAGYNCG